MDNFNENNEAITVEKDITEVTTEETRDIVEDFKQSFDAISDNLTSSCDVTQENLSEEVNLADEEDVKLFETNQILEGEELVETNQILEGEELVETSQILEGEELVETSQISKVDELAENNRILKVNELMENMLNTRDLFDSEVWSDVECVFNNTDMALLDLKQRIADRQSEILQESIEEKAKIKCEYEKRLRFYIEIANSKIGNLDDKKVLSALKKLQEIKEEYPAAIKEITESGSEKCKKVESKLSVEYYYGIAARKTAEITAETTDTIGSLDKKITVIQEKKDIFVQELKESRDGWAKAEKEIKEKYIQLYEEYIAQFNKKELKKNYYILSPEQLSELSKALKKLDEGEQNKSTDLESYEEVWVAKDVFDKARCTTMESEKKRLLKEAEENELEIAHAPYRNDTEVLIESIKKAETDIRLNKSLIDKAEKNFNEKTAEISEKLFSDVKDFDQEVLEQYGISVKEENPEKEKKGIFGFLLNKKVKEVPADVNTIDSKKLEMAKQQVNQTASEIESMLAQIE